MSYQIIVLDPQQTLQMLVKAPTRSTEIRFLARQASFNCEYATQLFVCGIAGYICFEAFFVIVKYAFSLTIYYSQKPSDDGDWGGRQEP